MKIYLLFVCLFVSICHAQSIENFVQYWDKQQKTVQVSGQFINGIEQGAWRWYWPNGKIKQLSQYKDGQLTGQSTLYYDQGNIEYQAFYKQGLLDSSYLAYHENKQIAIRGSYQIKGNKSIKIGIWEYFNTKGLLLIREEFRANSHLYWHYTDQNAKTTLENGNGFRVIYHPNQKIKKAKNDTGTK